MVTCTPPPGKTGNVVAAGVFDRLYSFKVINTTNFTNVFFNDALKEAARMVSTNEEIFDDLQAINRFNEILGSVSAPFTDIEQIAIEKAVEMMVTALNNIYEQGLIPRNGAALNEDEHPYLELVTNQIASRLGGTNISAEQLFNYNLLLAQTYRMAEHYDYALSVLGNLQTASGVNLTETEYWQCVCDAENNLLLGQIEPDQFSYQLEACRTMLYAMQKRQPVPMHGTSEVQSAVEQEGIAKAIFPNPTSSVLVVDLGEMNSSVSVEIIATSGVVVQRNSFDTVNRCSIDVSSLPSGTYLLKLITSQQSETLRFVKL
jgi:hypothetical protein